MLHAINLMTLHAGLSVIQQSLFNLRKRLSNLIRFRFPKKINNFLIVLHREKVLLNAIDVLLLTVNAYACWLSLSLCLRCVQHNTFSHAHFSPIQFLSYFFGCIVSSAYPIDRFIHFCLCTLHSLLLFEKRRRRKKNTFLLPAPSSLDTQQIVF